MTILPQMIRRAVMVAFVLLLSLLPAAADNIVVGGKNFTEQEILAELTAQLLRAKGFSVDKRAGLGSTALRQAQESGQVDVYWEYTGTALITYDKVIEKLDVAATYAKVKEIDAGKGLVWLDPSRANNTYALAMRAADAKAKGIASISDLAAKFKGGAAITLGSNAEFYARPDGLKPLETTYGFAFGRENIKRMDSGLVYQALRDGLVDVGTVFATDGRALAFHFVLLNDDKHFFPPYAITPVVRKATLDRNPKLAGILDALSAKLDDASMSRLNAAVDVDYKSVEAVAADFLKAQGLV